MIVELFSSTILFYILIGMASFFVIAIILLYSMEKTFDCKEKHVIVTGGSSGIGYDVAKEYLRKGAHVTLVARDKKRLEDCKKALMEDPTIMKPNSNQKIQIVSVDLSANYETVDKALKMAIKTLGPVSVLCCSAGTSVSADFESADIETYERMMRINYLSAVYVTKAVLSGMKKLRSGRIIFVSSQLGQIVMHGFTAYASSKWALRGFAEGLQMEVKPYNIYVSVSYPPDTDTAGYREEMKTKPYLSAKLSESGSLFTSSQVAQDIVTMSTRGWFHISTGLDGWLLKLVCCGMSPINSIVELGWQIAMAPFCRFIAAFYIFYWDTVVAVYVHDQETKESNINKKSK